MAEYQIPRAVEAAWSLVRFLNKYIDTRAPWALAKSGDPALGAVLRSMLLALRTAEGLVRPTLPETADAIAAQLGVAPQVIWADLGTEGTLPAGTILQAPKPIFPRLEIEKKLKMEPVAPKPTPAPTPPADLISIEDFMRVQLRVARVLEAETIDGSDKLLKLQLVIGEERRQVVAGIRAAYSPEDLIGRQVVIVFNLKPAKLRGVESQGMLLAAVDENGQAILLQPDREAPEASIVR